MGTQRWRTLQYSSENSRRRISSRNDEAQIREENFYMRVVARDAPKAESREQHWVSQCSPLLHSRCIGSGRTYVRIRFVQAHGTGKWCQVIKCRLGCARFTLKAVVGGAMYLWRCRRLNGTRD